MPGRATGVPLPLKVHADFYQAPEAQDIAFVVVGDKKESPLIGECQRQGIAIIRDPDKAAQAISELSHNYISAIGYGQPRWVFV